MHRVLSKIKTHWVLKLTYTKSHLKKLLTDGSQFKGLSHKANKKQIAILNKLISHWAVNLKYAEVTK